MKVPVAEPDITPADVGKVAECVASGWVSGISPYVKEFELEYAKWNGNKYAVATGSGTTALHLGLAALKIKLGDEVIMPSFTMIASANACHYLGARPVFVDIEPLTWNLDPQKIEEVITAKTKAIMPIHVYGHPANMKEIMEIALDHDLLIIEDCAEAHGAKYKTRNTGCFGDIGCYSFYANKIITTGEGGMVVTDDFEVAERAEWLRAHAFGRHGKHYWHEEVGYGYRMSGLQAALGLSQLERIEEYIQLHKVNAWKYRNHLTELAENGTITFPVELPNYSNVFWMFSILLHNHDRKEIMTALAKRGIETRTFFYPLNKQSPYYTVEILPITELISRCGINLPSGNTLNGEQIQYVCEALKEVLK